MTLRRAIRRFLRILLALAAVSLLAFWAVAGFERDRPGLATNPFRHLPLFVNPNPQGGAERARAAMRSIAANDAGSAQASQTLARLGGAALPHVLPELDSLDPAGRARVALALAPVALRMGVADAGDVAEPERAILFWNRFWQDRAIDFRPPVVKRLVARVAERSLALRREDLRHLDTYALDELIRALGEVKGPDDIRRVERLCSVLAEITSAGGELDGAAGVGEARAAVEKWRLYWLAHGSDYVPLDGARRIAAMVTETQYGKWFMLALGARFGRTTGGESVFDLVRERWAPTTALLAGLLLAALAVFASLRTRSLRPTLRGLGRAMPLLIAELPILLTLVVGIELVLPVRGMAAAALGALAGGDVNAWMGLSLALSLVTLVVSGVLDSVLSPAWAKADHGEQP